MPLKILICGLPGAGKTTLAKKIAPLIEAVHFNADDIRQHINKDLSFSMQDRVEQARRMGWLADQVVKAGHNVICDFVCPTNECREAFGAAFVIWCDRVQTSRFPDTNAIFEPPTQYDVRIAQ